MEVRVLNEADADAYRELRLRILREHPHAFTSSHDEEASKPLSATRERLRSRESPPARFVLGAFSETGRLLGSVGLSVDEKLKEQHKAFLFGMFTVAEERKKGIGRALLAECLSRASRIPGLEQINLTVTEGNAAERLYESAGFERFGVERRAIKCNGEYHGKIHMVLHLTALKFREITAADVPALFDVRPRTRENAMTVEELGRLGINPQSVTESLGESTKGWLCEDSGRVVAFSMADRATGEFLVIAVLPEYEGRGVGGRLMDLVEEWLAVSGCKRAWLTTDLDTTLRAYGFYRKRGWTDWKIERRMRWMELTLENP